MTGLSVEKTGSTRSTVFFIIFNLSIFSLSIEARSRQQHASFPPRGWNSYDSFCWTISEAEFLQSAEIVSKRLLPHGYQYVVVDYLWYRKKVEGAYVDSLGFDVIDEWGRLHPDPGRWPSSRGGKGFTEVAEKVHRMGLKFGIHVMGGISTQAYNANSLVMDSVKGGAYEESGRQWRAKDIGIKERACVWMSHGFMSVNTKLGAGKAFLRSLYRQYAEWGVDFIKHDCVFGTDFNIEEITYVSEVLKELDRPVLYSISPGTSVTPTMAKEVSQLVNMYRITGDDWDTWKDVTAHFDISRDLSASSMIGARGLQGKSWPDLDMLPLGWLTDQGSNVGPHRACNLNLEEQKSQMTLWSIAKSPLMFGGDVRNLDATTYNLITNPTLLEINSYSSNNKEFPYITATRVSRNKHKGYPHHPTGKNISTKHAFGLTSCKEQKANTWFIVDKNRGQICWNQHSSEKLEKPFCLYNRKALLASDKKLKHNQLYQGKLHLHTNDKAQSCLAASSQQKLTSKDYSQGALSPCKLDANQMWELHSNGTLENSYSGLCAVLNPVKAEASSNGVRSWIATGRRGEVYVAFFNLNQEKTKISAKISDIATALRGKSQARKYLKQQREALENTIEIYPTKPKTLFVVATADLAAAAKCFSVLQVNQISHHRNPVQEISIHPFEHNSLLSQFLIPRSRNSSSNGVWQSNSNGYYSYGYGGGYVEKRQLFLKSYQFSRKQSFTEKIKISMKRVVKKVVCMRLKSARRLKRVVWSRLKTAFFYRRRRFLRLLHPNKSSSYCFY